MLAWLKGRLQDLAVFLVRSLNGLLEWLFASRNPVVVFVRETIRRNDFILLGARAFIRTVRELPMLGERLKQFLLRQRAEPLRSILAARVVGGAISVSELEQIWHLATEGGPRVLAVAGGPELEQIRIMVRAARNTSFRAAITPEEIAGIECSDFDLVIVVAAAGAGREIAELQHRAVAATECIFRIGETSRRSDYFERNVPGDRAVETAGNEREPAGHRPRLRVVLLNDVGFQYGAGIALRRQAASFLLGGFDVHLVAWTPGMDSGPPLVTGIAGFEGWRGIYNIGKDYAGKDRTESELVASTLSTIRSLDPDIVVTGNLHGTGVPLELAQGLTTIDAPVVSYMHDCFWATGRCAYPLSCELYQTGCNETCPTADEYPKLAPDKIASAWRAKADIFAGKTAIPLVANSGWTRDLAVRRFGDRARIDCVPLALDHELFAPIPKEVARRLLGLPTEGRYVVMGAVDILNKWKGGDLFREIHGRLQKRTDVSVLLFGQSSALLKSTKSFGLVQDERLMPFILNSADIFIGTATEEAFGQTLLEASACGIPVVAFQRGGIADVVVDGQTGLLAKNLSADELYQAIDRLLADPSLRELLGRNGRKRVEAHFTLTRQAEAWIDYLRPLSDQRHRAEKSATLDGF